MHRLMKTMGLTLFFLVAGLILVNIFVIMPLLRLPPVQTTIFPSDEYLAPGEPDPGIIAVDSLTLMKKADHGEGVIYIDPGDETMRNPFFWPEDKLPQQKAKIPPARQPQLSMVIIGKGRRQALLDDAFVSEGDMYHGYLVKRIEKREVVLVDDLGEWRIHLAAEDNSNGQPHPPAGLIER